MTETSPLRDRIVWGSGDGGYRHANDQVDAANPKFLELVAPGGVPGVPGGTIDGVTTALYTGTVSVPALGSTRDGPVFDTDEQGVTSGGRVTWKLRVGSDHLPRRFTASVVMELSELGDVWTFNYTSFYSWWGQPVVIKAPAARLVISAKEYFTNPAARATSTPNEGPVGMYSLTWAFVCRAGDGNRTHAVSSGMGY
ncbi:hypothetical protein [Microtetraspora malaysiensis]|uniref:hypothetical protein n=1 Tax=Microtetraspora malaysiensis TaxID=161358 RepID=UPI0008346355|nr:hypothetical protein [Microtetraspora malaysiensis]